MSTPEELKPLADRLEATRPDPPSARLQARTLAQLERELETTTRDSDPPSRRRFRRLPAALAAGLILFAGGLLAHDAGLFAGLGAEPAPSNAEPSPTTPDAPRVDAGAVPISASRQEIADRHHTGAVRGRVVLENDEPVTRPVISWGTGLGEEPRVGVVIGGDDGRFEILELEEGAVLLLQAGKRGFLPAGIEEPLSIDGEHELPDLVLRPGVPVRGRVVDLDGRPVAGARVTQGTPPSVESTRLSDHLDAMVEGGFVHTGLTDDDGRFELVGLRPSPRGTTVTVEKTGFASGVFTVPFDRDQTLTLGPRATLRVQIEGVHGLGAYRLVLDHAYGAPPGRAVADPFSIFQRTEDEIAVGDERESIDLSPRYAACHYRVRLSGDRMIPDEAVVRIEPGQTVEVTLHARPGRTLRGRVVDARSDQPIEGVRVLLIEPGQAGLGGNAVDPFSRKLAASAPGAESKADGSFTLTTGSDWVSLLVLHEEAAPRHVLGVDLARSDDLTVPLGVGGSIVVPRRADELRPPGLEAHSLDSILVDGHVPITRGRVNAHETMPHLSPRPNPPRFETTPDAFVVEHLPAGIYTVRWSRRDARERFGESPFAEQMVALADGRTHELAPPGNDLEGCRVHGTVTMNGEPLANAIVRLRPLGGRARDSGPAHADAFGRFERTAVSPGTYELRVWNHSHALDLNHHASREFSDCAVLTIAPDDQERLVSLALLRTSVSGEVVARETGRPIAGATLWQTALGPMRVSEDGEPALPSTRDDTAVPCRGTSSDASGRFDLDILPAGRFVLRVSAPGYTLAERLVDVDDHEPLSVRFELIESERELRLHVPMPTVPSPFPPYEIQVQRSVFADIGPGTTPFRVEVRTDGDTLVLGGLPAGPITILGAPQRFVDWGEPGLPAGFVREVHMPDTGHVEQHVGSAPAGDLRVSLRTPEGTVWRGARVRLETVTGDPLPAFDWGGGPTGPQPLDQYSGNLRADTGVYAFHFVPAGPVVVVVDLPDGGSHEEQAEVLAGRGRDVILRLPR